MPKHLNVKIFGRVQGVFFRDTAKSKAEKLGLKGFARNEPDGTLYFEVEGEENNLKEFLDWCYQGPDFAQVEKIETEEGKIKNFLEFKII